MNENELPIWALDGKLNEVEFAKYFLTGYPMICVNNKLFDVNGEILDMHIIENVILTCIAPYVTTNIPQRIKQITETIKLLCAEGSMAISTDKIHVANGTLYINGDFVLDKEICINRLPVKYNANAPAPTHWLEFINELLEPEDVLTLQEYIGYCLIPTNKAQKMLIMIGKGGEGKSRVGLILRTLLGDNMFSGSVQKLESNRFSLANLENKLLMLDDDMDMNALTKTNIIKSVVTLEDKTELETKGKQSTQAFLYSRLFLIGNGMLSSLHDRSYGFFRRQIVLQVKDRNKERNDDPYLIDKMRLEAEGILLWALEGLKRLIANDYCFTISEKSKQSLQEAIEDSNNIIQFMNSKGYINLEPRLSSSSKNIYHAYVVWCDDNSLKPLGCKTFISMLKDSAKDYGLVYSNNVPTTYGKSVRGFQNINVLVRPLGDL